MKMLFLFHSLLLWAAFAAPDHHRRQLLEIAPNSTYDYVVVGCGIAGLVVAMRLSEMDDVSVLCVEAGGLDHHEDLVEFPGDISLLGGSLYDWNISTTPQDQLTGLSARIPMGRAVGGGSVLNGMIWNRGNQDDYNSWAALGNPGWSWNDLLPYFKKSENFTPVYYSDFEQQPVQFHADVHGFGGPVQVSYPKFYWPQTDNWFQALRQLNIPRAFDANDGSSTGGYFLPINVDPTNQTRFDARAAYYDPYRTRDNFDLLYNSHVTRVLFEPPLLSPSQISAANARATAVEYATNATAPRQTVLARLEVIIAAGAVHSPQILQLSGIGAASLLEQYSVPVVEDLVGVGNNFQDHPMVDIDYHYDEPGLMDIYSLTENASYINASYAEFYASRSGPWTAYPSSAVAFPALPQVVNSSMTMVITAKTSTRHYPVTYDATLQAGFELQLDSTLYHLLGNTTSAFEILNNNAGGLNVALMHPLSRGTVQIGSADPFMAPLVDPRWLVDPFDMHVMIVAMQFDQRIIDTPSIQELQPRYGINDLTRNMTADQATAYAKAHVRTEYHYSGSCSMMPRKFGGVVDPTLIVYGTSNLRVVDTSIFPLIPGAHLQAVAYAVAEKAADLIKGLNSSSASPAQQMTIPESNAFMQWLLQFLHLNVTDNPT